MSTVSSTLTPGALGFHAKAWCSCTRSSSPESHGGRGPHSRSGRPGGGDAIHRGSKPSRHSRRCPRRRPRPAAHRAASRRRTQPRPAGSPLAGLGFPDPARDVGDEPVPAAAGDEHRAAAERGIRRQRVTVGDPGRPRHEDHERVDASRHEAVAEVGRERTLAVLGPGGGRGIRHRLRGLAAESPVAVALGGEQARAGRAKGGSDGCLGPRRPGRRSRLGRRREPRHPHHPLDVARQQLFCDEPVGLVVGDEQRVAVGVRRAPRRPAGPRARRATGCPRGTTSRLRATSGAERRPGRLAHGPESRALLGAVGFGSRHPLTLS